jgi:hypothetical protein
MEKPTVPSRHRRRRARCDGAQPPQTCLALPPLPAHARPLARHHVVSARAGNEDHDFELEEIYRLETPREMAARFFRPSPAQPSRIAGKDQLHPDESNPQRIVRASGRLDLGLSARRSVATKTRLGREGQSSARRTNWVGRVNQRSASSMRPPRRARSDAPYLGHAAGRGG